MGEEHYENPISKCFPDDDLVPTDVNCTSESSWKNDKDNMEGSEFYALVDWDNTSKKTLNRQMTLHMVA